MVIRVAIFEELIKIQKRSNFNLLEEYTHLRGYHGCRPISVESYYQNGIVPIEKELAKEEALIRLKDKWITEDKILNIFDELWNELEHPHKSVWLTYSQKELIDNCGHYLIYGSEFICGMGAQLFCQPNLKKIGVPTIFSCDIPLQNIPEDYLSAFNQKIRSQDSSGGFRLNNKVLPSEIVSHTHPNRIIDPLDGFIAYNYNL
ncbi:hypothetical protein BK143_11575 [Paenibacillus peoriae]|uniref:hypothetical protein n=1 Tax=Paenibacillus peoriae TaxID=59893 RepID=UPI00096F907E|nr:hypothetical protein [Paenibacillus peoriae]OMF72870.1 hypothetical protein BK143_11575 [Paenibacillus peoriae]